MGNRKTSRPRRRASRTQRSVVDIGTERRSWSKTRVSVTLATYQGTTTATWLAPAAAISSRNSP
jgi:hypothetical protein